MEYQKAQHEMLKLKHRIIPIVLEDISNCRNMDKNLKGILNSVTYIEWPGDDSSKRLDRFWKKLQLSLPKKSSSSRSASTSHMHSSASAPAVLTSSSGQHLDSDTQDLPTEIDNNTDNIQESSSDAASIDSGRRSPKFQKNKKKDFKHFMDKLVRGKLFIRQDSTSSQAVLVDEETPYSKGSYDSVSESMFTESTDSACSTPITAHSYLNEEPEKNPFFCGKDYNIGLNRNTEKEVQSKPCEKDHCEFSTCKSCLNKESSNPQEYFNKDFCDTVAEGNIRICRKCKVIKESADNNIVKISPIDGSDMLKIQKVLPERYMCEQCSEKIELAHAESMKMLKDAENMKLLRQSRLTSSLGHRRTAPLREITLNVQDLPKPANNEKDDSVFIDVCESI